MLPTFCNISSTSTGMEATRVAKHFQQPYLGVVGRLNSYETFDSTNAVCYIHWLTAVNLLLCHMFSLSILSSFQGQLCMKYNPAFTCSKSTIETYMTAE